MIHDSIHASEKSRCMPRARSAVTRTDGQGQTVRGNLEGTGTGDTLRLCFCGLYLSGAVIKAHSNEEFG